MAAELRDRFHATLAAPRTAFDLLDQVVTEHARRRAWRKTFQLLDRITAERAQQRGKHKGQR